MKSYSYYEDKYEHDYKPLVCRKYLRYYYYDNGDLIATQEIASKLVPKLKQYKDCVTQEKCVNEDEIVEIIKHNESVDELIYNEWYTDLRNEYSELNDVTFKLCYDYAYDQGHSYGCNEVTNCMVAVVEFVTEILKCNGK